VMAISSSKRCFAPAKLSAPDRMRRRGGAAPGRDSRRALSRER
jgi:hypothetical protein